MSFLSCPYSQERGLRVRVPRVAAVQDGGGVGRAAARTRAALTPALPHPAAREVRGSYHSRAMCHMSYGQGVL